MCQPHSRSLLHGLAVVCLSGSGINALELAEPWSKLDQIVCETPVQFIHFETKIICNIIDIIVLLRKNVKILKMWGSNKNWNIWCWIWVQTWKVYFMLNMNQKI